MNFEKHFEGPAVLAKQLEIRWTATGLSEKKLNGHNEAYQSIKHHMPFLRRSLSYVREANQTKASFVSKDDSNHTMTTKQKATYNENILDIISILSHKKCNGQDGNSPDEAERKISDKNSRVLPLSSAGEEKAAKRQCLSPFSSQTSSDDNKINVYDPASGPPRDCKSAFALFCRSNKHKARKALPLSSIASKDDKERQIKENLHILWSKLSSPDIMYWTKEEARDKRRYYNERQLYIKSVLKKSKRRRIDHARKDVTASNTSPVNRVFFHYFYVDDSNYPAVQVESRQDRRCPLCFQNACTDLGLVLHCDATHAGLLFKAARDEEGNLQIAVQSDSNFASSLSSASHLKNFIHHRHSSINPTATKNIPSIKRPVRVAAALDLPTRKKKIKLLEMNGNDKKSIERYIPADKVPIRQYYHSKTNLPMSKGDWDYDSDEEPDDEWLHQISEELIDEFEDVSAKEKIFMKLWNRFIKSHTIVPDRTMPKKCMQFVKMHGSYLVETDLRQNLLLHLFNLWDFSVISSRHITSIMEAYDNIHNAIHDTDRVKGEKSEIAKLVNSTCSEVLEKKITPSFPENIINKTVVFPSPPSKKVKSTFSFVDEGIDRKIEMESSATNSDPLATVTDV